MAHVGNGKGLYRAERVTDVSMMVNPILLIDTHGSFTSEISLRVFAFCINVITENASIPITFGLERKKQTAWIWLAKAVI